MEKINYLSAKQMKSGHVQTIWILDPKTDCEIVADLVCNPAIAKDLYAWISDPNSKDHVLYEDKDCLIIYQTDKFLLVKKM